MKIHSSKEEILKAIRDVASDKHHFSSEVLAKISTEFTQLDKDAKPMLTKKESEVLKLIAQEFSNQEIAEKLNCGIPKSLPTPVLKWLTTPISCMPMSGIT